MKKILLSLLIIITAGTLSGCDGFKDIGINLDIDLNEKPDLKGLYPNSGMQNSEFANSYTTNKSEEITGYTVEYSQVLSGDQKAVVENAMIAKNDYDFMKVDAGTYEGLVGKQSFLDLKPYLEKFGQDLLEVIPQYAWDNVTIDGKIYAIPEVSFAGYGMQNDALVWNMNHLNEVGITEVPSTIGEVNEAFVKLNEKFNTTMSYSVFGLPASQAMCNVLSSAFEVPDMFYEDAEGQITPYIYHDNYLDYLNYLRSFVTNGYLFDSWQSKSAVDVQTGLANGNHSVGYLSYWNINLLSESYASINKISVEEARESFGYSLRIQGDGESNSVVQDVAMTRSSPSIGYYIVIPSYMWDDAGYAIDWMNEKIKEDNFFELYTGEEGVHYNVVTSTTPNAIETTYNDEIIYIELTDQYSKDVEPNSMYHCGVNTIVSQSFWALREASYNCWDILYPLDETCISNPISIMPYLEGWSSKSITAKSWIITYEQKYANQVTLDEAEKDFEYLQRVFKTRYWTDTVSKEVQDWYDSTK